ncbi:MAG: DUF1559 domain-containing protein, partial [Planctomycetota bacterium]
LLLPAVQSAREAARKTQCTNQLRQMMLAMHNHVSSLGVFPGGGIKPWPQIEDYSANGKPFGPERQGLSWAFQILPYMEDGAVYALSTTAEIESTPISNYFCPSRRPPTLGPWGAWLIDYAAVVPNRSRQQVGDTLFDRWIDPDTNFGCLREDFWGSFWGPIHSPPTPNLTNLGLYYGFWGVIVRSNAWKVNDGYQTTGFYTPMSFKRIKDGSSKTLVLGEKRVRPENYTPVGFAQGTWHDDRGWSDGWDPDTLRATICPMGKDSNTEGFQYGNPSHPNAQRIFGFNLGAAHPATFNAAFADGSGRTLSYDTDIEVMNQLGHRSDGAVIELEGI